MSVAAAGLAVALVLITEGPAGKSSSTHLLADSAADWTGSWRIGRLDWGVSDEAAEEKVGERVIKDWSS